MGHIIVTGAGSGLGRALTIGLVERGHRVSMMGRRYQRLQEQEQLLGSAVIGIAARSWRTMKRWTLPSPQRWSGAACPTW